MANRSFSSNIVLYVYIQHTHIFLYLLYIVYCIIIPKKRRNRSSKKFIKKCYIIAHDRVVKDMPSTNNNVEALHKQFEMCCGKKTRAKKTHFEKSKN